MNKIAEGFERFIPKEFKRFPEYSPGPLTEVMSILLVV
jgi:hypothetical protein